MGAVVTGRPVESAWLLRRGGRDSPRKDSLQAQSRRVQKICQLLIKKITISITAQHFSVDQSTSKLSASYFYFFYYYFFFRMMRTRRPSLFLMSCTCNSVVSVLPFNSVSLRLRGRLLMHLWPGHDCMDAGSGGVLASSTLKRKEAKVSDQGGEKHTRVLFVWNSQSSSFFNPTCTSLCTQTLNCLYIVSLHQMCVWRCELQFCSFFFKQIRKRRLWWWQLLTPFTTVLMGGLGSSLGKIICMVHIIKLRTSLLSTNLRSVSRASLFFFFFARMFC